MVSRSLRNRLGESTNIWPGFVDVLATLLIVIIFVLMVFTVSQIYLSDAISGRDKALQDLRNQIDQLSKILTVEISEKEDALSSLSQTQSELGMTKKNLESQRLLSDELQTDISKKRSELFVQEQNILALSEQITKLLNELRIVSNALETYEGIDNAALVTEGLGERINKALATRIDQLKSLNLKLDETNQKLAVSESNLKQKVTELNILNDKLTQNESELELKIKELNVLNDKLTQNESELELKITELNVLNDKLTQNESELELKITELNVLNDKLTQNESELELKITELNEKNNDLLAINQSLGIEDGDLAAQLNAIQNKNDELLQLNNNLLESKKETEITLQLLEKVNTELTLRDEELQNQILQYKELMSDLLAINDTLGLNDVTLQEQLDAIRFKNQELVRLNENLIEKDSTIFDLRGKIIELNDILSISEEQQLAQKSQILTLKKNIQSLEDSSKNEKEISSKQLQEMEMRASLTLEQVASLTDEIDKLKNEILTLNRALLSSEKETASKNLEIEALGERLNKALTSQIFELQKYRSEFFGKLQSLLGDREDIKVVGDRFIFQSELLFDSASANLQKIGKEKLKEIGITLKETTSKIPTDIDWIIQVEGHTDKRPINTTLYPSNWELSSARANSVLKLLLDLGFEPNRLAAAGYGEFYPISNGDTERDFQQNRRIELKLTSR